MVLWIGFDFFRIAAARLCGLLWFLGFLGLAGRAFCARVGSGTPDEQQRDYWTNNGCINVWTVDWVVCYIFMMMCCSCVVRSVVGL